MGDRLQVVRYLRERKADRVEQVFSELQGITVRLVKRVPCDRGIEGFNPRPGQGCFAISGGCSDGKKGVLTAYAFIQFIKQPVPLDELCPQIGYKEFCFDIKRLHIKILACRNHPLAILW